MTGLRRLIGAFLALGLLTAVPTAGTAQGPDMTRSDIVVLDPERLFEETELGKRMLADHKAEREALAARNRKLEAELEAEEKRLTELRDETSPEEFRELADDFDTRVQELRRDSERRVRRLERKRERLPLVFLREVEPVLIEVMRKAGGTVVLDARTVLFRADAVDVTDAAITRIDAAIGAGPEELPEPEPERGAE